MQSYTMAGGRKNRRGWIFLAVIAVLLIAAVILYTQGFFRSVVRRVGAVKLRCVSTQDIQPFGADVLYYDGDSLFCMTSAGVERWSYRVGSGASYNASDGVVVIWRGTQLSILNRNGRSTYDNNIGEEIQFARAGSKYIAVVHGNSMTGDDRTAITFYNTSGDQLDMESTAYQDMLVLDAGFFSNGDYAWTTAMDMYGTVPSTTMNTYQVSSMNTGTADLGETLTYRIIYAGGMLNVVGTRKLRVFDYHGTENTAASVLVYGWKLIDDATVDGKAMLLFAPTRQTNDIMSITELRCLLGRTDKRMTLPDECVGAGIYGRNIYAFSAEFLYKADINATRFSAVSMPITGPATEYIGMLSDGTALVAAGLDVYAVTVP